jgi:HAMP domain-containing protein
MNMLAKVLLLIVSLSLMPLAVLSILSLSYIDSMESAAFEKIDFMQEIAVSDSMNSLNELGATIIKNQAMAAKELVELYIRTHPDKNASDLISDEEFQRIAIQPVGERGYTVVIQTRTQNIIAHPNTEMMGKDLLEPLRNDERMQDWWRVVEPTWENNIDSSGYYQWPEADGTYSDKYMYLAVIDTPLQGKNLSIAATTYIDEFNAPAKYIDEELTLSKRNVVNDIMDTNMRIQHLTITTVAILVVSVIVLSTLFSNMVTRPIKMLKEAVDKVAAGDLTVETRIGSSDEIGDLGKSFGVMLNALKKSGKSLKEYSRNLEKKVKERTKELEESKERLEEKNKDLERINKVAIGRELKMIELKKTTEELKKKVNGSK